METQILSVNTKLPRPSFSRDNPYWRASRFLFIKPEFRPRFTAHDFLYATTWELNKPFDVVAASYVKMAMLATYKANFTVLGYNLREQFRTRERQTQ